MTPHQTREELLRQHDRLRRLLAGALGVASQLRAGEPAAAALEQTLAAVRIAFEDHNRYEEMVLSSMLGADARDPARIARLREEHAQEHTAFLLFLSGDLAWVARGLPDFVEEVEAHMAAEERVVLNVAVLRDPSP